MRCVPRDSVDRLLEDWARVRPELDVSPVGIVTRMIRVRAFMDAELEELFAEHGLSAPGFAVLVTLVRLDEPDGVSQRRLMTELGLSSGTVSFRMERLERAGLIERRGDPDDRRNVLIRLTDDGRALFERVAPAHLANEQRMLSGLTDDERATLADLLRKLLVEYEGSTPPPDATLALGLTLAPAHKAMQLRRTVGLPDIAGLLVRTVDEDSPAARAGLTRGDILLRAAGRELRAVSALYEALDDAADGNRRLRITVLRGTDQITATLKLETRADAQLVVAAGTPFQEHRL